MTTPQSPSSSATDRGKLRRNVSRALLVLGALASLAYLGYECYLARRQAKAAAAVRSLGGRVIYADELPHAALRWPLSWINSHVGHDYAAPVVAVHLANTAVRDGDLACLGEFGRLQALWLNNTAVSDEGMSALRTCRHLQELSLRGTQVGDAGLKKLTCLQKLEFLYLHDTKVSDASLAQIEALPNLKLLSVPGTKMTQEGVGRLRQAMPGTRIGD